MSTPVGMPCSAKVPFDTKRLALVVVARMRKQRTAQSQHLQAYRCPECGKFHVGKDVAPAWGKARARELRAAKGGAA